MDRPTSVKLKKSALKSILAGVNAIYDPIRLTLGPQGANYLLYRTFNRGPRISNDGVTGAKAIEPKDEAEQLVAHTFREAAEKTNSRAGDGTTTTIVIGGKLMNDVIGRHMSGSSNLGGGGMGVMALKRQLQDEAAQVAEKIKERSHKIESIEDLQKIATVSVEDPELGKTIAKMAWDVGVDGFIDVVEGYKGEIETELLKGMRIPAKVPAKGFLNNPQRFEMIAEDVEVVVTNFKLDNVQQVADFLNPILKEHPKLAIFAPEFSSEVLTDLWKACFNLQNGVKVKKNIEIYPIHVPSLRTEQFEDLAIYTGAQFINKDVGRRIRNLTAAELGFAGKIVVKDSEVKEDASIVGGGGTQDRTTKLNGKDMPMKSLVAERIDTLKAQIDETRIEIQKKMLERRIASMGSAVGIIRVGGASSAESLYRKLKIEDAVYASKAALEEGWVKGGGLCLKEIAEEMPEALLAPALRAPYEQIQENAEGNLEIPDSVIDPTKAVRLAVEHAVSVCSNLATVKILIPEERDVTPGEGYSEIAKAIALFTRFYAKQHGLIREGQDEADRDFQAMNEERMFEDQG